MPRIPENEIERIKREVDLVALVRSKGVELKRHGSKDLAGRCPFHEEETASFIVTPAKNLWHCMGCGKGGSVIDFVMAHEGLSFRHAFEVLAHGGRELLSASRPVKHSSRPKLESPVALDADDHAAMRQVFAYYHQRLKQTPAALEYLRRRGISEEAIEAFHIGFADRTLGLRLPRALTKAGGEIRDRLKKAGVLRAESGHEHLNGCVVFPIFRDAGSGPGEWIITEAYGRKINDNLREGTDYHMYLPGPHAGIFNRQCLTSGQCPREIILCEAVIDALSFWCAGIRNVTCIYGTEGFTDELWRALLDAKVQRVYLAYDRDAAGDRAAARDSERLLAVGIECLRVKFPAGMDANEYARKVTPADKSLRLIIRSAEWLGAGSASRTGISPECPAPVEEDTPAEEAEGNSGGRRVGEPPAHSSFLAASWLAASPAPDLAADTAEAKQAEATKEKSPTPTDPLPVERLGEDIHIALGDRQWRVRGLDKNNSHEVLRVNLRLMYNGLFYINVIDLYQDKQRRHFIEEAAKETVLEGELIKRDLGKLLLQLETMQEERIQGALAPSAPPVPPMSDGERKEALELLRAPDLLQRILADYERCGIVGETTNKLAGYLAAVSRKLDEPLAIIIQSTSAAGKSSLMDAILAFVPEEERIKYSAMTGQSLYYLGDADLKHKVLAIVEEEGAERASYALKLLQSEGELTIASTGKDPQTGRMVTQEYRVEGPVMIILTTTAIDIDEELMNRCIVLTVDESREQTRAIHALQREKRTLEGLRRKLDKKAILATHRNAQRLLRPLRVVNPFAGQLTFQDERTRTRRDHEKYLTLIDAVAFLHQYQRPVKQNGGASYVEVTLGDIELANRIAGEALGRSLDELPPQTRRFLNLLHGMVTKTCGEKKCEPRLCPFSQRQAREYTGWSAFQVKKHLSRLAELEYVLPHRGRYGQSFVYELVYDGEGRDGSKFLTGLIDVDALRGSLLPLDYDGNREHPNASREHQNGDRERAGSPPVAPLSRGGSTAKNPADADEQGNGSRLPSKPPKNAPDKKTKIMHRSHSQPPAWRDTSRRGGQERQEDGLDKSDPHGMGRSYETYLEHLAVHNYAAHTITGRRLALIAFLRWCQDRDLFRPQDVTRPVLESYQRWMHRHRKKNGKPLGFTTQRGRLVAIKDYFRWLCRQNLILHNPASELEMPRNERKLPKGALNESEIERILSQPDIAQPLGIRDRAMLETLYSTGIRRTELVRLELGDLNPERGVLMVRQGKGKKDRVVPVGERALVWIGKYLADVRPEMLLDPREQALFLSGYGDSALNADYLSRLVSEYVRKAGITHGGCHLFRHSCATLMLENGADIRFIQQMLGHANLSTTQIYTEVSIRQLQRVHAMTHPAERDDLSTKPGPSRPAPQS